MRKCCGCHQEMPKGRKGWYCLACSQRRYQERRQVEIRRARAWQKNNPERHARNKRRWKQENRGRHASLNRLAYHRSYWHGTVAKKRRWINENKLAVGCKICGYKERAEALTFHHTDPKKKRFSICLGWPLERIKKEAKQCEVLCRNCHAIFHADLHEELMRREAVALGVLE